MNPISKHPSLFSRRRALAAAVCFGWAPVWAQPAAFPSRPMRIVVPFPPGGYADVTGRLIATELSTRYGQAVTVDNKPGAGGNLGAEIVARAPADGHTLLMGTIGTQALNLHLYKKLSFDPHRDFEPLMFIADAESVLVAHPQRGFSSVADLIRAARAKPGGLSYASAGIGSTGHLAGELFEEQAKVFLVHIPYRGNAPALNDLVAGQIDLSFATLQTALPFIQSGQLKPLAVLGRKRSALLPELPTLIEAGLKDFDVRNWAGLLAPAGTPAALLERLYRDIHPIMQLPDTQARLARLALAYIDLGPKDFAAFTRSEAVKWGAVVKAARIEGQ